MQNAEHLFLKKDFVPLKTGMIELDIVLVNVPINTHFLMVLNSQLLNKEQGVKETICGREDKLKKNVQFATNFT